MQDRNWSPSEKKAARAAFDEALDTALAKIIGEFKVKASAVATPSEMWEIEGYLRDQRQEIDEIFDYRYSQLLLVFARLVRKGYLDESRLSVLSEDKRQIVRSILSHAERA